MNKAYEQYIKAYSKLDLPDNDQLRAIRGRSIQRNPKMNINARDGIENFLEKIDGIMGTSVPQLVAASSAGLIVTVPADAVVEIEGINNKQTGTERHYMSPALEPGKKYHYTVKASWIEGGKPVSLELDVPVVIGKETKIDFVAKYKEMKETPHSSPP